jgi:hypothetical protein
MNIKKEAVAFLKFWCDENESIDRDIYKYYYEDISDYFFFLIKKESFKKYSTLKKDKRRARRSGAVISWQDERSLRELIELKSDINRRYTSKVNHYLSNFGYTSISGTENNITEKGIVIGSILSILGGITNSYLDKKLWADKIKYIQLEKERGPELKKEN